MYANDFLSKKNAHCQEPYQRYRYFNVVKQKKQIIVNFTTKEKKPKQQEENKN